LSLSSFPILAFLGYKFGARIWKNPAPRLFFMDVAGWLESSPADKPPRSALAFYKVSSLTTGQGFCYQKSRCLSGSMHQECRIAVVILVDVMLSLLVHPPLPATCAFFPEPGSYKHPLNQYLPTLLSAPYHPVYRRFRSELHGLLDVF